MSRPMRQIHRSFDVLEAVARDGPAGLAQLSARLGLPRATVHRLLRVLGERGYVDYHPAEHTYAPGATLVTFVVRAQISTLKRAAGPALVALRSATGETVNLGVLDQMRIVYAATLDGLHVPRMSAIVGQEAPAHATALGKAILARMPAGERPILTGPPPYPAFTPHTRTDPAALDADLVIAAQTGFATDFQEMDVGAVCIAAPICNAAGSPLAAISVSGIVERLPRTAWDELGRMVKGWCDELSAQLHPVPPTRAPVAA